MTSSRSTEKAPETKPARGSRHRVGLLIVVLALCGAGFWGWRIIEEKMRPTVAMGRALRSGDVDERLGAAEGLGVVSPEEAGEAIRQLIAGLDDPDDGVRAASALSLGRVGLSAIKTKANPAGRDAVIALTRAIADPAAVVRMMAANALGQFAGSAVARGFPADPVATASALAVLIADKSPDVRKSAGLALGRIGDSTKIEAPPALIDGVARWESAESRAKAASVLGSFRANAGPTVLALTGALKDRDPEVRYRATLALQEFGPEAALALPALVANLDDPYVPPPPEVDPRMAGLSLSLPSNGPMGGEPNGPAVEAARAIGVISNGKPPSDEIVEALTKASKSARPELKQAAEEALRMLGKGES